MADITNVTTNEVRFSYVHLFKPYAHMQGQEPKFSVTVLVPKTDTETMNRINAAIEAAKARGVADKWNGVVPPIVPNPVYDGDGVRPSDGMAFGPECKGHWVFAASAKADYPPEIVDAMGNPIINQSEVYSGMYGRVNVTFYPYSFGGKKGIGCGLGPVQKTRDGETLGGGMPKASSVFGAPQSQSTGSFANQSAYTTGYQAAVQGYAQPSFNTQQTQTYGGQPAAQPAYAPSVNPITGMPV